MSNINFPSFPDGFKDSPFGKDNSKAKRGRYQFKFLKEEDVTKRERGMRRLSTRKADAPYTGRRRDVALGGTDVYQWVFEKQGEGIVMKIEFVMTVKDNLEKAFVIVNSEAMGAIMKGIIIPKLNAYRSTPLMKIIRHRFGSIDRDAWNAIWQMDKAAAKEERERSAVFYTPKKGKGETTIAVHEYEENTKKSSRPDYYIRGDEFIERYFPNIEEGIKISKEKGAKAKEWKENHAFIHFHTHYSKGGPPSGADYEHYEGVRYINQAPYAFISERQIIGSKQVDFLQIIINVNFNFENNNETPRFKAYDPVYIDKKTFEKTGIFSR